MKILMPWEKRDGKFPWHTRSLFDGTAVALVQSIQDGLDIVYEYSIRMPNTESLWWEKAVPCNSMETALAEADKILVERGYVLKNNSGMMLLK